MPDADKSPSILKSAPKLLFAVLFIVVHLLAIHNFVFMSRDMINGDFSAKYLIQFPLYGFMRVPGNLLADEVEARNRLAADFGQIYFPTLGNTPLAQAYSSETLDPWRRPSRYAPLVHAVCAMSLCKLSYGYASIAHIAVQLIFFYLSFFYAFRLLRLERHIAAGILLVNFCLFLTPVGLSWFERGQFSLYVALAHLWLMLGILNKNVVFILLSAIFAYIKLTSFPFISVALGLWVLNSKNALELKQSVFLALAFALVIASFFLLYLQAGIPFIEGIMAQELDYSPAGLSLAKLFPRFVVKALPLILIILGYTHIRKYREGFEFFVPYLVGCGIILSTYPTLAYDYSVPGLFAFLPLILYWSKRPAASNYRHIALVTYFFPVFLIVASNSVYIMKFFRSDDVMVVIYLSASLVFLFPAIFYPRRCRVSENER